MTAIRRDHPGSSAASTRAGDDTLEDLIEGVEDGLLIHHAAWIDQDEITTNFGAEIRSAQEILMGQLGEGIVGGTVSGSTLGLINRITGISDTAEIISAPSFGCVAPYIRFSDVNIAGPT